MTSKDAKKLLIGELGFRSGYLGAATEVVNCWNADVIAVRWSRRTVVEFEIKLSRADLMSEVRAVRIVYGLEDDPERHPDYDFKRKFYSHTKFNKHRHYRESFSRVQAPHMFYFAVPDELVNIAAANLQGTPYGVYNLTFKRYVKKARRLHEEPATAEYVFSLFSRACVERFYP